MKNETKVKIQHDNKWYSLKVDSIDEDSSSKTFIYSCSDSHISELGKTGFKLIFDTELENNFGTIIQLGEKVVEGTDWEIDTANSDILIQTSEEPLYSVALLAPITVSNLNPDAPLQTKSFLTGNTVYIYYSSITDQNGKLQVLYSLCGLMIIK